MPAPVSATYSAAALAAAQTSFLNLLDAGTGAAKLKIRDSSDVLLASMTLNDPAGTVDGGTGRLTIDLTGGIEDASADASGTAAYGEFTDSDDVVHLSLPAQAGTSPVAGYLVMNTLTVVSAEPVQLVSATIG